MYNKGIAQQAPGTPLRQCQGQSGGIPDAVNSKLRLV